MKFLTIKLFVLSVVMFAATSAFASLGYDVNVNTSDLTGTSGYLYYQYNTAVGSQIGTSTATVQNFATDGVLGSQAAGAFADSGSYVTGALPGAVSFSNGTLETNDYNQAITFGNSLYFNLLLPTGSSNIAGSIFSFWLASDAAGLTPLKTGELFDITLNADGTATTNLVDTATTTATPTPIPAAAYLLGSGLMGLVGMRRRKNA